MDGGPSWNGCWRWPNQNTRGMSRTVMEISGDQGDNDPQLSGMTPIFWKMGVNLSPNFFAKVQLYGRHNSLSCKIWKIFACAFGARTKTVYIICRLAPAKNRSNLCIDPQRFCLSPNFSELGDKKTPMILVLISITVFHSFFLVSYVNRLAVSRAQLKGF